MEVRISWQTQASRPKHAVKTTTLKAGHIYKSQCVEY